MIKKGYFLCGLLVISLLWPVFSFAQTIKVCSGCEYTKIKDAISSAEKGDTIVVDKGVYQETDIVIEKPLTLIGKPGTVVDGQNQGEIFTIEANYVTVDGFTIKNVGSSSTKDFAAVRTKRVQRFTIQNLHIVEPFFAIYLEKSNNGIVRNNHIEGRAKSEFTSGNGIHLWYSSKNLIENNISEGMRDGIYCEFADENLLVNNNSRNNIRYGLHFMFSNDDEVRNNVFSGNGAGIAVMFSKRMDMIENTYKDNWGATSYGVLLKEVVDSRLLHNVFYRNTTAINMEGTNRTTVEHNDFKSNGWAINSKGGNYDNDYSKNNFLENSFDLAYSGRMNNNTFNGNYWSEYSGYDLDKDGIGDVPYRPVKLFSNLVNRSPEAIILLRSIFVDIIDFAEKVSPVFTPDKLLDETPKMKMIKHD